MTIEKDSLFIRFGSVCSPYSFRIMFLSPDALCSYGVEVVQPNVTEKNLNVHFLHI